MRAVDVTADAVTRAAGVLSTRWRDGAYWDSPLIGGPVQIAAGLIATNFADARIAAADPVETRLLESLLAAQNPDGSFSASPGLVGTGAATRIVRIALRLAGRHRPEAGFAAAIARADAFLATHDPEGPAAHDVLADVLAATCLAEEGNEVAPYPFFAEGVSTLLAHPLLAPVRNQLSATTVPMLTGLAILLEHAASRRWLVRVTDAVLAFFRVNTSGRHLRRLERRIVATQEPNGCWGWAVVTTAVNVVALAVRGAARHGDAIARGLGFIRSLRRDHGGAAVQCYTRARTWDTSLAAHAIVFAGGAVPAEVLRAVMASQRAGGLFTFDPGLLTTDNDSTAAALLLLARERESAAGADRDLVDASLRNGVAALLRTQHEDGGWGFAAGDPVFDGDQDGPGPFQALIADPSTPDLTARVLLAVIAARQSRAMTAPMYGTIDRAADRAISFLRETQRDDGTWAGVWTAGGCVTPAYALPALRAFGVDMSDGWIRSIRHFLVDNQQPDGSWGNPVDTAFALMGLAAYGDVADERVQAAAGRAVAYLRASQTADDTWTAPFLHTIIFGHEFFASPLFDHVYATLALRYTDLGLAVGADEATAGLIVAPPMLPPPPPADAAQLQADYRQLVARAEKLGGRPEDIPRRVVCHFGLYRDSKNNFTFPLLALHGACWAHQFLTKLEELIPLYAALRSAVDDETAAAIAADLREFTVGLKAANKRVFVSLHAVYQFSKRHGRNPLAAEVIEKPLLSALNRVHLAAEIGVPLTNPEKRRIYAAVFAWEQVKHVGPMMKGVVRNLDDELVKMFGFRPIVKFSYFPPLSYLFFSDFSQAGERIEEGWKAYTIAEREGWEATEKAIAEYEVLPGDFLERPGDYLLEIEREVDGT